MAAFLFLVPTGDIAPARMIASPVRARLRLVAETPPRPPVRLFARWYRGADGALACRWQPAEQLDPFP
jgi:hypothetical protein